MMEEKDEIDLFLDSQVKTEKELLQENVRKLIMQHPTRPGET